MSNIDYYIAYESIGISRVEAEELEKTLSTDFDNASAHLKLIGYYSRHYYCCEEASKARFPHVEWLLMTQPEFDYNLTPLLSTHLVDREGYAIMKALCLTALTSQPSNPTLLRNISALVHREDPAWAEALLCKAVILEPSNDLLAELLTEIKADSALLLSNRKNFENEPGKFVYPSKCPHISGDY